MNTHTSKWDQRFFDMACLVASWSKDETKVGAVIVRPNKTVASVGFNGFPMWMDDSAELYQNRETKLARIVHAEMNAILFCNESIDGHTLYLYPFLPCDRCAVHVIQSGIARVVAPRHIPERWKDSLNRSLSLFDEANVEVFLL